MVLASGCSEDSPTSADYDRTIISSKAVVITGNEGLKLHGIDGSTYIYRIFGYYPEIVAGSILIGTEAGGYLRKAISVIRTDNRLIVETVAASLTDAVIEGRTDTLIHVGFEPFRVTISDQVPPGSIAPGELLGSASPGLVGLNLSGLTLYSGDAGGVTVDVTITEGHIDFYPELSVGMKIKDRSLEEFYSIAEGTIELNADVTVNVSGAIDHSYEIPIVSLNQTAVHYMGRIPVISAVELRFSAGFELSSGTAGNFSTNCTSVYDTRIGSSFSGGNWTDIGTNETEFTSHASEFEPSIDNSITVYVKPNLHIVYYSVDGSQIAFKPFHGFAVETRTPPIWYYEVFGGITGVVENRLTILDYGMADHATSPLHFIEILESGPYATDDYIFIGKWGSEGTGEGQFSYPKGITLGQGENAYIVDHWNHRVQQFDLNGSYSTKWGNEGGGDGFFYFPKRAAADPSGNIYVVDSGNYRVQKFTSDGTFLSKWGNQGSGDGEFQDPEGIAVDNDGNIYVADYQIHTVQKFTSAGGFVTSWGGFGSGEGQLGGPVGIAVDPYGYIYVSECLNNRIQKFTSNGDFDFAWGTQGSENGQFDCPIDVAVDAAGNVYVADYGNDRIQKFTANGDFLLSIGSSGSGNGEFDHPEGVAVDAAGNVYVVDSRNNRIQKFAPINR